MTVGTSPADSGFRPILKWPGGKWREWARLAPHLPAAPRHLVDPFMGGLAPFARTAFTGRAYLNDRHPELVDLHMRAQAQDPEFLKTCDALADDWHRLAEAVDDAAALFSGLLTMTRRGERPLPFHCPLPRLSVPSAEDSVLSRLVADSLADKARRIARLEVRHETTFEDDDLPRHAETALRAAYYTLVRARERDATGAARSADFLFVRDFCYGSMFRTNADGVFNIPYGGASYNVKQFANRVAQLRSDETVSALTRAQFSCGDFEPFLEESTRGLDARDFVFLDPPYHSDFSTYGPNAFSLADHERLAAAIARLPCRWLLVIKETPEVRELYVHGAPASAGGRELLTFGKQYGYNVRGRNERGTRHLVMSNHVPEDDAR